MYLSPLSLSLLSLLCQLSLLGFEEVNHLQNGSILLLSIGPKGLNKSSILLVSIGLKGLNKSSILLVSTGLKGMNKSSILLVFIGMNKSYILSGCPRSSCCFLTPSQSHLHLWVPSLEPQSSLWHA